jgi:hypothetical protein
VITSEIGIPRSLTIIPLGYCARCTEAGCKNLGRMILRCADAGGPMSNFELCQAHADQAELLRNPGKSLSPRTADPEASGSPAPLNRTVRGVLQEFLRSSTNVGGVVQWFMDSPRIKPARGWSAKRLQGDSYTVSFDFFKNSLSTRTPRCLPSATICE